jgi:low temperature requirement protein LtrA
MAKIFAMTNPHTISTNAAQVTSHSSPDKRLRRWHRPMLAREMHEPHRASTPLELFFDLIFVVAISLAAGGLHHGIAESHSSTALVSYAMLFFTIWWAWMGFTWFASSFDSDDVPYRLMVFVQMAGALVIAAGVTAGFEHFDFRIITVGYFIMRIGLVSMWLRAGKNNPALRPATNRYALGLTVMQFFWISLLFVPMSWKMPLFLLFMVMEMLVPAWAERSAPTPAHPEHINERYSLFTIIVLGESILATVLAIKNTLAADALTGSVVTIIISALVIVLSLWWLYFDKPNTEQLLQADSKLSSFIWGYGHYFIFASAAAVGVGLAVAVEFASGTGSVAEGAHPTQSAAQWALALPVATFLVSLWGVHLPLMRDSPVVWLFPSVSVAVLLTAWLLPSITLTAGATALLTAGLLATLLYFHYDAKPRASHAAHAE